MKDRSIKATALSYSICFILLVILIEGTWGITAGALIGAKLGGDKVTQEEISRILKDKGIREADIPDSVFSHDEWQRQLPEDARKEIQNVINRKLHEINWFGVTLAISAFVFAVIGFLCGFINRAFVPIGLIVVLSFLVNNPIVRFPYAKALGSQQKVLIVLAQFVVCYLLGYLGDLLGRKRDKKRLEISTSGS